MAETQPKRRTQRERRAQSEQRIIRAAADLFAEQGYLRTTLNQIGSAAGYTGGLVSHRFGSKEGLLQAVVARMTGRFRDEQLSEAIRDQSGAAVLESFIEAYLNEVQVREKSMRTLYVIIGAGLAAVPEVKEGVTALNRAAREVLATMIKNGQNEGDFRTDITAEDGAVMVLGILRGVVMQRLDDHQAVDIPRQTKLVKEVVLNGLAA